MKVMVMGGGGAMAKGVAWELVENPLVEKIVLADLHTNKAKELAEALNSKKVAVQRVDATDHKEMVQALAGIDTVANCAWYELNMPVMKACLDAGCHYLDLGGLYYVTLEQLKLHEDFKKAGLIAILGIGASPGMTNVCIGKAAQFLDEVNEVHIRTGAKGGAAGFAYSAKTIIDEVTMQPAVLQDKKMKFLEPLTGREKYVLPDPVGEVEGFYSIHSELATVPSLDPAVHTVTFRVAFSPKLVDMVNNLLALRLLSDDTVEIGGVEVSAKDFLLKFLSKLPDPGYAEEYKSFQVNVTGNKEGKSKELVYETVVSSIANKQLKATAVWTGFPLAVAIELIIKEKITKSGVFPPETGIPPVEFFQELAKRNIVIKEKQVD